MQYKKEREPHTNKTHTFDFRVTQTEGSRHHRQPLFCVKGTKAGEFSVIYMYDVEPRHADPPSR
jgi:hypothetical protein